MVRECGRSRFVFIITVFASLLFSALDSKSMASASKTSRDSHTNVQPAMATPNNKDNVKTDRATRIAPDGHSPDSQKNSQDKFNLPKGFVSADELIKRAEALKLSLPVPESDGRFQTMNKRGAAIAFDNNYTRAFAKFSKSAKGMKVLHVDATYGHQTLRAVDAKQSVFIVTDSSLDHLSILAARARNLLDKEEFSVLKLFYGDFPEHYKIFDNNSFDAVLLNRTIHFNSPAEVELTMKEVYRILKPGGKLYVVAITPYVRRFESFITVYKQRMILAHRYPGYVKNLKVFANPEVTSPEQMDSLHSGGFMFFDARILYRLLTENHFFVMECQEFPIGIKSDVWALDGREMVGAIAKKPIPTSLHDHLRTTPADF